MSARPRVLLFCDDKAWGGIVTYCVQLARLLPDAGFDVTLLALEHHLWHDEAARQGVTVLSLRPPAAPSAATASAGNATAAPSLVARLYRGLVPQPCKWLLGSRREYQKVRRLLEAHPADLIHVQSVGGEIAALAASHRRPRVPVITTIHFPPSMVASSRHGAWAWRLVSRLNMRAFDIAISVSRATLLSWTKYSDRLLDPSCARVVYNGAAEGSTAPSREVARRQLDIPAETTVLLNIAALVEYKDQATLLQAFRHLLEDSDRPLLLLIAGDGPARDSLAQQIGDLALHESVRLLGHRSDTATLLAAADLYVQSSREEAFPMVLLEAGLRGVPVVATDVGGVRELVVDGESGVLVRAAAPDALADGVRRVLRSLDAGASQAQHLSARIQTSFLAEHMLRDTTAVYREALERAAAATASQFPSSALLRNR